MRSTQARTAAVCAVAAAILTLAGCTSGSSASTDAVGAEAGTAAAQATPDRFQAKAPAPAAGSAAESGGDGAAARPLATAPLATAPLAAAPVDGSKIIKTANLSVRLVVAAVPATADQAADRAPNASARSAAIATATASVRGIASAAGGFQASADGGGSQMSISLRVPADQYDGVVDKLAALGELTNRTETSQDVTADLVDVASRVDSMTASVARVRGLLAQATNIADVISIESELSVREANLESLQQQQAALQGQVAMSTISLVLTAETDEPATTEPADDGSGFLAGLQGGWAAMLGFLVWFGGVAGALLPFLPLLVALALALWWVARRLRRRVGRGGPADPGSSPGGGEPVGAAGSGEPAAQTVGVGSS